MLCACLRLLQPNFKVGQQQLGCKTGIVIGLLQGGMAERRLELAE